MRPSLGELRYHNVSNARRGVNLVADRNRLGLRIGHGHGHSGGPKAKANSTATFLCISYPLIRAKIRGCQAKPVEIGRRLWPTTGSTASTAPSLRARSFRKPRRARGAPGPVPGARGLFLRPRPSTNVPIRVTQTGRVVCLLADGDITGAEVADQQKEVGGFEGRGLMGMVDLEDGAARWLFARGTALSTSLSSAPVAIAKARQAWRISILQASIHYMSAMHDWAGLEVECKYR